MGCGASLWGKEKSEEVMEAVVVVVDDGEGGEGDGEDDDARDDTREAKRRNKLIEDQLHRDRLKDLVTVKVLLLGGPSSGKTTIFKQMRILHLDGFTESDYVNYRYIIHSNVVVGLEQVLEAAEALGHHMAGKEAKDVMEFMEFLNSERLGNHELSPPIGDVMTRLWTSESARFAWSHRFSFDFLEGTKHFLDSLDRLCQTDYRPSYQDILFARFRTTGIYEMSFLFRGLTLRMVDVGGQKSEQKKWIHCFDNVQTLLFVASLADYDLYLEEEPTTNRMMHSIDIFGNLCVSPYFKDTAFILFLNKKDIFAEKILSCPLTVCFESYDGTGSSDSASSFILKTFAACFPTINGKMMYGHFTTATDTDNINKVFDDCMHQVLHKNMSNAGVA